MGFLGVSTRCDSCVHDGRNLDVVPMTLPHAHGVSHGWLRTWTLPVARTPPLAHSSPTLVSGLHSTAVQQGHILVAAVLQAGPVAASAQGNAIVFVSAASNPQPSALKVPQGAMS